MSKVGAAVGDEGTKPGIWGSLLSLFGRPQGGQGLAPRIVTPRNRDGGACRWAACIAQVGTTGGHGGAHGISVLLMLWAYQSDHGLLMNAH